MVEPKLAQVTLKLNGSGCGRLFKLKLLQLWKFLEVSLAKVSIYKVVSGSNDG